MKVSKIVGVFVAVMVSVNASAASDVFMLKSKSLNGSKIQTVDATSPIPFNKSFVELTNEQQAIFKAQYQDLRVADRPPFPVNGLKAIYQPILKKNKSLANSGTLSLSVLIDSKGRVENVTVVETPSPELENYAKQALVDVAFEPAICGADACSMTFPVELVLL